MSETWCLLITFDERFSKNGSITFDSGTVPTMILELSLTLFDTESSTFSHLNHVIRMFLTKSSLFPFHTRDVITKHPRVRHSSQLEFT